MRYLQLRSILNATIFDSGEIKVVKAFIRVVLPEAFSPEMKQFMFSWNIIER
jgi:hypothetical protein